MLKLHL